MQHSSWYTWACVLAYSYSFIAFGLQVNLLGPTASVLARKLGVVEADLGVIFTINGLASILGAMPSGYLVDKMPGHLVLAAALAFEVRSIDMHVQAAPYEPAIDSDTRSKEFIGVHCPGQDLGPACSVSALGLCPVFCLEGVFDREHLCVQMGQVEPQHSPVFASRLSTHLMNDTVHVLLHVPCRQLAS